MSDDSDAFASADESLNVSVKENNSVKEGLSRSSKANIDGDNNDSTLTEQITSKPLSHSVPLPTKDPDVVEVKKKKTRLKKPKSTPKQREKMKKTPSDVNLKSDVKRDTTSVSEVVTDENTKSDTRNEFSPSFEKVGIPAVIEEFETRPNGLKLEKSVTNSPDTSQKDFEGTDEPSEQITDSYNPNQPVECVHKESPLAASNISEETASTSTFELHSVIDKLSKVEPLTELDFITSAASNIARGLGDGISSLVGVLGDVIQLNPLDGPVDEEKLKRRTERQSEEESERRVISEAWNNVWNTSWTDIGDNSDDNDDKNDGWEVDYLEESEDVLKSKSNSITLQMTKTSLNSDPKDNPSYDEKTTSNTKYPDVEQHKSNGNNFSWGWSGLSSLSQQLTSSLQATSLNLVQGGVDVLELIGRKTMSVLAENDPGYEYTKKFLHPPNSANNRPNLSKILREAYELHSSSESTNSKYSKEKRGDFTYQLEYCRALLHLESLELVSEQASNQLNNRLDFLSSPNNCPIDQNYEHLLETIWNHLNLDETSNDEYLMTNNGSESDGDNNNTMTENSYTCLMGKLKDKHILDTNDKNDEIQQQLPKDLTSRSIELWCKVIKISCCLNIIYSNDRFLKTATDVWNTCDVSKSGQCSVEEIFFQSISSLAQFTSAYLEYLHKFSECILVKLHKIDTDFVELSQILACFFHLSVEAQVCLCQEFIKNMKSLREKRSTEEGDEKSKQFLSVSQYTSSLLLECSNAGSYLKNAFNLLIPVVQLACINHVYPSKL
ncbi:unnamed protein product [Heterobilharzia americana]|nr:unnamed protein product [Heterobilharzia americana]